MEQNVTFDSGGLTLTGIVHTPDDLGPIGCCLTLNIG